VSASLLGRLPAFVLGLFGTAALVGRVAPYDCDRFQRGVDCLRRFRSARRRADNRMDPGAVKRPQIKTFTLEQALEALAEIKTGHVRGKLVVIP